MRVRELTVNSKFYVVWRVAQLFALTGISKVNDIVYWLWYFSHILCGLFYLNLHWVFVLISRRENLLEMLVEELVQNKMRFLRLQISPVLQWSTSKTHSSLGSLRYHTGATAAKTSLKKWICVFPISSAIIPTHNFVKWSRTPKNHTQVQKKKENIVVACSRRP